MSKNLLPLTWSYLLIINKVQGKHHPYKIIAKKNKFVFTFYYERETLEI